MYELGGHICNIGMSVEPLWYEFVTIDRKTIDRIRKCTEVTIDRKKTIAMFCLFDGFRMDGWGMFLGDSGPLDVMDSR